MTKETSERKGYSKAVLPELIKVEKEGEELEGIFCSITISGKFKESWALDFTTKDGKSKRMFINSVAKQLFETQEVKKGQEFILVFEGMVKSDKLDKDGNEMHYRAWELFIKNI